MVSVFFNIKQFKLLNDCYSHKIQINFITTVLLSIYRWNSEFVCKNFSSAHAVYIMAVVFRLSRMICRWDAAFYFINAALIGISWSKTIHDHNSFRQINRNSKREDRGEENVDQMAREGEKEEDQPMSNNFKLYWRYQIMCLECFSLHLSFELSIKNVCTSTSSYSIFYILYSLWRAVF